MKRLDIQSLRALAVLSVFAFHLDDSWVKSGLLGVDIFFVISGYVITQSLAHRHSKTFSSSLVSFYVRRVKRLLPALVFCVLTCGSAAYFVVPNHFDSIETGMSALFAVSNFYLFFNSTDYFAAPAESNIFTHTWSLGVEEQYYLIYPVLFYALFAGVSRLNTRLTRTISLLTALSILVYVLTINQQPEFAFYLLPARFWELGVGCLIFLNRDAIKALINVNSRSANAVWLTSLCLILVALFMPARLLVFSTLLVVSATCAAIIFFNAGHRYSGIATNAMLGFVGEISYSLYLWHWPVIVLFRHSFGVNAGTYFFIVIIAFALSCLSYFLVERPLRHARWTVRPSQTLAAAALSVTVSALGLSALLETKGKFVSGNRAYFASGVTFSISGLECHIPQTDNPIGDCLAPDPSKPGTVFIMGDSHARDLVPAIHRAVSSTHNVQYLTGWALVNDLVGSDHCGGSKCVADEVGARLDFLQSVLRPADFVVLAMSRDTIYPNTDFDGATPRAPSQERLMNLEQNLRRLLSGLVENGSTVVLVEDIPKVCSGADFARSWLDAGLCVVSEEVSLQDRRPLSDVYARLADEFQGEVKLLDPHDYFCEKNFCSNTVANELVYIDSSPHLSFDALLRLAPMFSEALLAGASKK